MENLVPSWLMAALHSAKVCDSETHIMGYSIKPANLQGNTSCLFKVSVEYKSMNSSSKAKHFIIKFARNEKNFFVSHFDFASKEPIIYRDYLPRANEKVNYKFAPNGFSCSIQNGLILEDLTKENYSICDKTKQLDYAHCEKVFLTIAKFHAASVACYHENPSLVEVVGEEVIHIPGGPTERELKQDLDACFKLFLGYLSEITISKEFFDLLSSRFPLLRKSITRFCQRRSNGLNVLNHGDLWTNNILFQYDDNNEITDIKFIDFQLTRWTSPLVDLLYFIWTSANENVRSSKLQPLINTYLETLNKQLEALGCAERMTLRELTEEMASSVDWVIGTISQVFPFIIAENDSENLENVYQGKHFRTLLPSMIRNFQMWYNSGEIVI